MWRAVKHTVEELIMLVNCFVCDIVFNTNSNAAAIIKIIIFEKSTSI